MAQTFLQFFKNLLLGMTNVFSWLSTPQFTKDQYTPFDLLYKIGVVGDWIYELSPLEMISGSLAITLGFVFVLQLFGKILDAIPII